MQVTFAWPGAVPRWVLVPQTGPVTDRLRVREIDDDEGRRLVRIVRRGTGSVVTWRRAQMVLLSAQGMDVAGIAKVTCVAPKKGPVPFRCRDGRSRWIRDRGLRPGVP